jgi:hypothetical protein
MFGWILGLSGVLRLVPDFVWKLVGMVLLVLAAYFYGDVKGTQREHAKCEAAAKIAQDAANRQDTTAGKEIDDQDKQVTDELKQQVDKDADEIRQLQLQLDDARSKAAPVKGTEKSKVPSDPCVFPAARPDSLPNNRKRSGR